MVQRLRTFRAFRGISLVSRAWGVGLLLWKPLRA